MNSVYNAPIKTNIVVANTEGISITWDTNKVEYESFFIENQGDVDVIVTIGNATILLSSESALEITQDNIVKIDLKTNTSTSNIFYMFQGYFK